MKIEVIRKTNIRRFCDLVSGEVFEEGGNYYVRLRGESTNAADLETGMGMCYAEDTEVAHCPNARLVID